MFATRPKAEVHEESTVEIFVDEATLVTRHNVEALLAELWS